MAKTREDLMAMSKAELVEMYNSTAERHMAVSSFGSKKEVVDRILQALVNAQTTQPRVSTQSVREVAEEELTREVAPGVGKTYGDVLDIVRHKCHSSTTLACLRWYAVQMRARGDSVPDRPRATRRTS